LVGGGDDGGDALARKLERDAARFGDLAAAFGDGGADVRGGAVDVVGEDLDDEARAAWAVAVFCVCVFFGVFCVFFSGFSGRLVLARGAATASSS
jgi:hypothetical protein